MSWRNNTVITEFIFLGLSDEPETQVMLFVLFLIVYMIILLGNSITIFLTITNSSLQTPMYFFLTNLSFIDISYSSSTVPRMLKDFLSVKKTISFAECATQMYISLSLGVSECILLAIMAYDRYVAICFPLHYTTIINRSICIQIAFGTWACGFLLSISHVVLVMNEDTCGHNEINHFVCEVPEILSLGCGNTLIVEIIIFVAGVIVLMIPVIFIVISYVKIIKAILKMASSAGQQKAFSTCGSHIIVVTMFYGSAMATYMKPKSRSLAGRDKITAILYTIVMPLLNPLIYTLRNKDVKTAMRKCCTQFTGVFICIT
ncbi:olfactory receptor 5AR1-like [Pelodytes ibericus]